MRENPENQSFVRSAVFAAILSILSGCGPNAQGKAAEENDQNPPAGPADIEEFTKADIKPNAPKKEHPCTGMKITTNDAGVMEMDFSNDGPNCP